MTIFEGLTIAVIATTAVAWVHHLRGQRRIARQCVTLSNLHECLKLVNMLQRHRDIALTHDALEVAFNREALQSAIGQSIHALAMEPEIADLDRWLSIRDHWQRLGRQAADANKKHCYEQHNNLIANLLTFVEEVAETAGFTKQQFGDLPNIHLMWRELPWILEYLSQARLLGSSAQTSYLSGIEAEVQLRDLDKQIRRLSRVTFDRVRYNGPHDEDKSRLVDLSMRRCMDFTASLQQQLRSQAPVEDEQSQLLTLGASSADATQQLLEREMRNLIHFVQHG